MFEENFRKKEPLENELAVKKSEIFKFERGGRESTWLKLEKNGYLVEGALYEPEKPNEETVLFVPGCVGDSVSWFEDNDMDMLLDEGYKIFVTRHSGVKVNEYTKSAVHNAERTELSDHVGKENLKIEDWMKEPEVALEYFSGDKITVISHSLGGLTVGTSLIELARQNKLNNVVKWINLAGVTYDLQTFKQSTEQIWTDFINGYLKNCCEYPDASKVILDIENAITNFNNSLSQTRLPETLRIISVNPRQDEYVPVEGRKNLHEKTNTGLSVIDETLTEDFLNETKKGNEWAMVHDFLNLKPETLFRLVKMTVSKHRHDAVFRNPN